MRTLSQRRGDIGFHYDVGRPANHHQVLDIVAAYENEPPAPPDTRVIDHCESLRAARRAAEAAQRPYSSADQSEHSDESEEELTSLECGVKGIGTDWSRETIALRGSIGGLFHFRNWHFASV